MEFYPYESIVSQRCVYEKHAKKIDSILTTERLLFARKKRITEFDLEDIYSIELSSYNQRLKSKIREFGCLLIICVAIFLFTIMGEKDLEIIIPLTFAMFSMVLLLAVAYEFLLWKFNKDTYAILEINTSVENYKIKVSKSKEVQRYFKKVLRTAQKSRQE